MRHFHMGVRPELNVRDWGAWRRDVRVDTTEKGVLVVAVYDTASGRLAWRGAVTDVLASDPEKADEKTRKAVEKLLKKFPAAGS